TAEAPTTVSAGELAHRQRQAVEDGEHRIVRYPIDSLLPESFFEPPQVRCLTDTGCPMQRAQRWAERRVVPPKIGKQRAVLDQAQVLAHHFHRQRLAVGQSWVMAALAEAVALQHCRDGLVNEAKHNDTVVVQVHGPSSGLWHWVLRVLR